MLLKMSLNVMSARKNSGQQVITRNTFFFTKKKRRNWYVMNVGRGLAIPPSLTTTHKSIHLKKYINAQIGGVAKHVKCCATLKHHFKKHNEKKYKCPHCTYVTDLQHYLKDHMMRNHGAILVCEYFVNRCDYTTHHRSSLTRHEAWCENKLSNSSNTEDGAPAQ